MAPAAAVPVHLADYRPVPYGIARIDLCVRLGLDGTEVEARMEVEPRGSAGA
jgi:hypothetical protein